jgi:dolichol-phosphate mannosyltransferase
MRIGMNGIIGYSQKPLAIMATVGFLIAGSSLFLAIYFFGAKLFFKSFTPGLSTMGILLTFFSGVQIFSIGVLGAYMGRIYSEVRNRPIFIVQEKTGFGEI